ncbi:MAG TPA: choice-of-anchor tandem repeat GloVer-containing protein [Rhizomicrobium sp.]|nr:choice-of-anchor tandem repeat GloVer-containing protein [Rhizomicrobium sp.]
MERLSVGLFAGAAACIVVSCMSSAEAAAEKVLYSFCSQYDCTDGALAGGNLVDVDGTFYSTTYEGGENCQSSESIDGCGTVVSVDPKTGAETVIYSFCSLSGCADGAYPPAGMIDVKGTLYGTTSAGGNAGCMSGCGTVFSLDPATGAEKVIYSFCSRSHCTDGGIPEAGLIDAKGTLYGTTSGGGNTSCRSGCGTAFSIDPKTGAEKVIYSFCGQSNCADGEVPEAGLIAVKGTLYGTTFSGGSGGGGTVFSLDPITGAETVLHAFCSQENCTDGKYPDAGLISVNGTLYGTTSAGGGNTSCDPGCGTVFSVDPATGAETVLYSFCSQNQCIDGARPSAGLIDVKDMLYGTTYAGGDTCEPAICCKNFGGCGTVFSVDPNTGAEAVLHSFCDEQECTDGRSPETGLIDVKGTLYGTVFYGGENFQGRDCFDAGCGAVFSIKP